MQEYYLKVEAYNDRYYRDLDYLRTLQFEHRLANQCIDAKSKPTRPSDLYRLPMDSKASKKEVKVTTVTQAQKDSFAEKGITLVNPTI